MELFYGEVNIWVMVYDNDLDAWNPELWARESIEILNERMLWGNLVHRDFESIVAAYGDTVNTRMPGEFESEPYVKGDTITLQDATATNVAVKLDQIEDVSIKIYEVEQTFAFADLVSTYLDPMITALARKVDRKIAGQSVRFLGNTAGGMGGSSSSTIHGYMVDTEQKLNDLKVHEGGRQFVFGSKIKADMLKTGLFVKVNESGSTEALRKAWAGDLFGMNSYMSLNVPSVNNATLDTAAATTTSAAIAAGATATALTAAPAAGQYFTIAGDLTPLRLATSSTTGNYINRSNRESVASGAAVVVYEVGAVDLVANYALGYSKKIHVDGTGVPHVGQLVSFGVQTQEYCITSAVADGGGDYDITLDRPLEAAITNDLAVNYGPNGSMNLAFNRNAIAMVTRPLSRLGGGLSAVASDPDTGLSLRIAMERDINTKSMIVSADILFGIQVLNANNGAVLLG